MTWPNPFISARWLSARKHSVRNHHLVGTSLNNLAVMYYSQGQYEKAEPLFSRSLTICEEALGPNHPKVANILNNLALLYSATKQFDKAAQCKQRADAIRAIER